MEYLMQEPGSPLFRTTDDPMEHYKDNICGGGWSCTRINGTTMENFFWNAGDSFWQAVEVRNHPAAVGTSTEKTA